MFNHSINKIIPLLIAGLISAPSFSLDSTCYGSTANGRLDNGVKLPVAGENYTTYSQLAHHLGRTYVGRIPTLSH